jgi:RNAse (barnase) inhibitor barstar
MKIADTLSKIFSDPKHSGVYGLTGKTDDIERAARAAGLSIIKLDLGRARGKTGLLALLARTLKFPKYFGQNWDALHDVLTDLAWLDAKGWLVIITNGKSFAARHREHFATAIKVLRAAAGHWGGRGKPFWVIIQGDKDWDPGLPRIPDPEN